MGELRGAMLRTVTLPVLLSVVVLTLTSPFYFAEVVHYYLYCEQSLSSPFQQVWGDGILGVGGGCPALTPLCCPSQALTVFQRSLTTMQMQTQGLIQFALPLFPMAEVWGGGSGVWPPAPICSHPSVLHRKTSWGSSSC